MLPSAAWVTCLDRRIPLDCSVANKLRLACYPRKDDLLMLKILYVEELTTLEDAYEIFVGPHLPGKTLLA